MRRLKLLMAVATCLAALCSQASAIQFFNIQASGTPNDVLDGFAFDIDSPEIFFSTPAMSNFFANPVQLDIKYEAQVEAGEGYLTSLLALPVGFTFGDAIVKFSATVYDYDSNIVIGVLQQNYTGGGFGSAEVNFSQGAGHIRVESSIVIVSESGHDFGSMSALSEVIGTTIPEPGTISLAGAGIAAFLIARRRKGAN